MRPVGAQTNSKTRVIVAEMARKKRALRHAAVRAVGYWAIGRLAQRVFSLLGEFCLVLVVHVSIRAAGTSRFSPPSQSEGTTAA